MGAFSLLTTAPLCHTHTHTHILLMYPETTVVAREHIKDLLNTVHMAQAYVQEGDGSV